MLDVEKTKWDLSPLLAGDEDPKIKEYRKVITAAHKTFVTKWKSREDYLNNPKILKEALDDYERLMREHGTCGAEGYYFRLRREKDKSNAIVKGKFQQMVDFSTALENELHFFIIRLGKVPKQQQQKFLKAPELKPYHHYLKCLFVNAQYMLSESEEKIMNLKSSVAHSNWVKMVSESISKEERTVLDETEKKSVKNFSELTSLISSKNKKVRDEAASAIHEITSANSPIAEAEINAILQNKKIDDELRGMSRPDLARHISDDIDSAVVDALVASVTARFDIAKRFYILKAKLLGLPKLEYHERNVEYGSQEKKYNYEDALKLVHMVLSKLDPEFGAILEEYSKNGQIDVYPQKGKRDGAFCDHYLITQPTYILLNHTDKLRDVLTIAHEVGHGINNELIKIKQHSLYFDTPLATAEVASTFMEDFVLQELIREADDELRLSLLVAKLGDDVSTIIRQVACYKFEQELHAEYRKRSHLTKEEIGTIFQKNMAAYMGSAVEQSRGSENWWVYWSHIRRFFYVYSYASGLLISKALQREVKRNPKFIEKVKVFLSAGTSDSPQNIFKALGIDITKKTFWDEGLDEIEQTLKETEELARKLGKI